MNSKYLFAISAAALLSVATTGRAADATPSIGKLGIYNSRAVALAWGRSTQHNLASSQLYKEAERAKAAGDKKELARLKKDGSARQERLEKQVFGDERIPDIMKKLEPRLPEITTKAGVTIIIDQRDAPKRADTVDVTSLLVAEFHPTDKTLQMIEEMLKHKPLKHIPKH